jgi:DNA-binding LacI/PurR family transcriptional regulator
VNKRPTIVDVARAAGVSIAVVSYALNGRPGVSEETRARVLRIAAELGWRPSAAARSMRSGPKCVGLVLPAGGGTLAGEDRLLQFVTALQATLAEHQIGTLVHIADDLVAASEACTRWWAERQVFAVVLPDVRQDDPRMADLVDRGIPTVGLDGPQAGSTSMVWADDGSAAANLADYLLSLGHQRLARVTGRPELAVTRVRDEAFTAAARRSGASVSNVVVGTGTGAGGGAGAAATRRLLQSADRPSAIVYDDDEMAISALDVARRLSIDVPWELSIVAGVDSSRCRLAVPSLTALTRNLPDYGTATGELLLDILQARPVSDRRLDTPTLTVRGSTAPPLH